MEGIDGTCKPNNVIGRYMCPRAQYTDLSYMEGTGSCEQMRIIFGSVIKSWYSSLNIKFGANRSNRVYHRRTDGQTDIAQMSPRNIGSQINVLQN